MVVNLWKDFGSLYKLLSSLVDETENLFLDVSSKKKNLCTCLAPLAQLESDTETHV